MPAEQLPAFFNEVPRLIVRDPLAGFLGSAANGILDYGYADAVRLAGHSCPTVASAYALTHHALSHLYPGELPVRGAIRASFQQALDEGVTGVIAAVVGLLTGSAQDGGFKGLAGQFARRNLQSFSSQQQPLAIRFTRTDNGATVDADADLSSVPPHPETFELMRRCMRGEANAEETRLFGEHWQARVKHLLLEHWDDPRVFHVAPPDERGNLPDRN